MKKVKNWLLQPKEICEYANTCKLGECKGRNKERENKFSCGLRRGFLITDGFWVEYTGD